MSRTQSIWTHGIMNEQEDNKSRVPLAKKRKLLEKPALVLVPVDLLHPVHLVSVVFESLRLPFALSSPDLCHYCCCCCRSHLVILFVFCIRCCLDNPPVLPKHANILVFMCSWSFLWCITLCHIHAYHACCVTCDMYAFHACGMVCAFPTSEHTLVEISFRALTLNFFSLPIKSSPVAIIKSAVKVSSVCSPVHGTSSREAFLP